MKIGVKGIIDNGKFLPDDPDKLDKLLQSLNNKIVIMWLEKEPKNRTEQENRYYWGVIIKMLADHCGYSSDDMNEIIKFKFLYKKDEKFEWIESTKHLDTIKFENLMSDIRDWSEKFLKLKLPKPNEILE